MLDRLGEIRFRECRGKYSKVRGLVEEATSDPQKQGQLYQVLFQHGGRCDCTVDRNVVRVSEKLAQVEAGIQALLGK